MEKYLKKTLGEEYGKKIWTRIETAVPVEFYRSVTLAEDGKPCDYCFVRK
ncbi:MAG: hypothetical protein IKX53_06445 [Bacteroidales bacterium]|nr:hypothetical protein [Bacteroidales bacterium]